MVFRISRLRFGAGRERVNSSCTLMSDKGLCWSIPSLRRTPYSQLPSIAVKPGLMEQGKLLKIPFFSLSWLHCQLLVDCVDGELAVIPVSLPQILRFQVNSQITLGLGMMRKKSVGILFSGLSLFSYKYPFPISPLFIIRKVVLLKLALYYKKKAKLTR